MTRDDLQLEGKAVLIIGGSRGIGAATATAFASRGARVVMAARTLDALQQHAQRLSAGGAQVKAIRTDMTDAASLRAAVDFTVESFGRLDIAFNNAGINTVRARFAELSDEDFDLLLDTNLRGVFIAMKHEIIAMLKTGGGSIVNTASAASLVAMPSMAAYVASKHGVLGLTKSAAFDYANQGIRVNAIAPGAVMTEMLLAGSAGTPEGRARIEAVTPMKRIGTPEEMAEAVLWLSSPRASYVTGTILPVDGGYVLP
ncbi:MAG: glucose 1-dehydrogenase [Steroidobacteraceae bacterium]